MIQFTPDAVSVVRSIDADGEDGVRELILREREQEVRLILGRIDAALEKMPSGRRIAIDARVMTGRDGVRPERGRALRERRELEVAVAVRARQRRPPGCVL